MQTVIHWFRNDLRVSDNTALSRAARVAACVVPVYILDEEIAGSTGAGPASRVFLLRSVISLKSNLETLGYGLVLRRGKPGEELPRVCRETGATAVFCNKEYEPEARRRDQRVFNALNEAGIGFESFKDGVMWEEEEILSSQGEPYKVFTPYAKVWRERKVSAPWPRLSPARGKALEVRSVAMPEEKEWAGGAGVPDLPDAGERAARKALTSFLGGAVFAYAGRRDFPAMDGTSRLSPHFRAGTINVRTVLDQLKAARTGRPQDERHGADVFVNELIWREFYIQVLANFPRVANGNFREEYDALEWSEDRGHFEAWCEGRTGYPIVDAAMRCLRRTGWLHNRLRMIVAMFLTKDLMIHRQWGERWFMRQLVDGDQAANNGGWQWSAGTGTDAAPYFRIFNPVSQGERFDQEGDFVRRWVPELASAAKAVVHRPWEKAGMARSCGYAERIVIHEEQRARCLAMFRAVKG